MGERRLEGWMSKLGPHSGWAFLAGLCVLGAGIGTVAVADDNRLVDRGCSRSGPQAPDCAEKSGLLLGSITMLGLAMVWTGAWLAVAGATMSVAALLRRRATKRFDDSTRRARWQAQSVAGLGMIMAAVAVIQIPIGLDILLSQPQVGTVARVSLNFFLITAPIDLLLGIWLIRRGLRATTAWKETGRARTTGE